MDHVWDPLQGTWRKDSRSTDADRKKESELLTYYFDHLRYSLFRRANVRGAGFRPRLVQVCMQIRWKVRWGRIAGPCGDSGYSVVADPPRWLSDVLIGAYRRADASGAGTDETTLDKITCGTKPSGRVPGHVAAKGRWMRMELGAAEAPRL